MFITDQALKFFCKLLYVYINYQPYNRLFYGDFVIKTLCTNLQKQMKDDDCWANYFIIRIVSGAALLEDSYICVKEDSKDKLARDIVNAMLGPLGIEVFIHNNVEDKDVPYFYNILTLAFHDTLVEVSRSFSYNFYANDKESSLRSIIEKIKKECEEKHARKPNIRDYICINLVNSMLHIPEDKEERQKHKSIFINPSTNEKYTNHVATKIFLNEKDNRLKTGKIAFTGFQPFENEYDTQDNKKKIPVFNITISAIKMDDKKHYYMYEKIINVKTKKVMIKYHIPEVHILKKIMEFHKYDNIMFAGNIEKLDLIDL